MIPYIWLIFMVNLGKYTIYYWDSLHFFPWAFKVAFSGTPREAEVWPAARRAPPGFHRWINVFKKNGGICSEIKIGGNIQR